MEYYKKVEIKEHMLYARELAEIFGIFSKTGKPAIAFVSHFLKQAMDKYNYEQYYYYTKDGLKKVYPASIYLLAFKYLKEMIPNLDKDNKGFYSVEMNNHRHYYIKISETKLWNSL